MASRTRRTRHGSTVSLVYTPPDQRRKGYATACVAALSQIILDSGKDFCTLFTDLANPTSNDIYIKIGYVPLGDFTLYRFVTL
jgi:predicted GNAT family acetyltransferase